MSQRTAVHRTTQEVREMFEQETRGQNSKHCRAGNATERPLFYSVAQVARMFGTSPVTLYRAIAAGEFPAVRIRGRLIVPARAVEAMADMAIAEHTVVDAAGWVPHQTAAQ
jgi:excisionase family DNA binding protein